MAAPARAVDHNNLDAGRPLRFDDAEPLAFREQSLELGFSLGLPGTPQGTRSFLAHAPGPRFGGGFQRWGF